MQIKIVQDSAARFLKENASTVLTAGGVVGTVATGVLAFRGGLKTSEIIREAEVERTAKADADGPGPLTAFDKAKLVWPYFIPPIATGTATIAAIIMADRMSASRAAALAAAYGVSQRQLDEYKTKVAEKLGVQKTEKLQDELAQDRVNKNPNSSQIIIFGDEVLCYDQPTDRYFKSTMETIKRAENAANSEIIHHGFCHATFFYDELELEPTTWTGDVGWCQPFKLEITTTQTPDGKPCLAIDFDRLPVTDYVRGRASQY